MRQATECKTKGYGTWIGRGLPELKLLGSRFTNGSHAGCLPPRETATDGETVTGWESDLHSSWSVEKTYHYLVKSTNCQAPHYADFLTSCRFTPLRSLLSNTLNLFLPLIWHIKFYIHVCQKKTRRHKIMVWILASILRILCALFLRECKFDLLSSFMSEHCHTSEGIINYVYEDTAGWMPQVQQGQYVHSWKLIYRPEIRKRMALISYSQSTTLWSTVGIIYRSSACFNIFNKSARCTQSGFTNFERFSE